MIKSCPYISENDSRWRVTFALTDFKLMTSMRLCNYRFLLAINFNIFAIYFVWNGQRTISVIIFSNDMKLTRKYNQKISLILHDLDYTACLIRAGDRGNLVYDVLVGQKALTEIFFCFHNWFYFSFVVDGCSE